MAVRQIWPRVPVRWLRVRRGAARSVQHVVAVRYDDPPEPDNTLVLCGQRIGDGAQLRDYWFDPATGRVVHGHRHHGPKTQRPLVTPAPREGWPVCRNCQRILAQVQPLIDSGVLS